MGNRRRASLRTKLYFEQGVGILDGVIVSRVVPLVEPGDDRTLWLDVGVDGTPESPLLRVWREEKRGLGSDEEWPIISVATITTAKIADDAVTDAKIDFGTGAGQVSAADIPLADAGAYFPTDEVESALQDMAGGTISDDVTVKDAHDGLDLVMGAQRDYFWRPYLQDFLRHTGAESLNWEGSLGGCSWQTLPDTYTTNGWLYVTISAGGSDAELRKNLSSSATQIEAVSLIRMINGTRFRFRLAADSAGSPSINDYMEFKVEFTSANGYRVGWEYVQGGGGVQSGWSGALTKLPIAFRLIRISSSNHVWQYAYSSAMYQTLKQLLVSWTWSRDWIQMWFEGTPAWTAYNLGRVKIV